MSAFAAVHPRVLRGALIGTPRGFPRFCPVPLLDGGAGQKNSDQSNNPEVQGNPQISEF